MNDTVTPDDPDGDSKDDKPLTLLQMLGSVLAAAVGVQSSRNRERDFERGKPLHFIILGVLFTVAFVGAVVAVVSFVLRDVG